MEIIIGTFFFSKVLFLLQVFQTMMAKTVIVMLLKKNFNFWFYIHTKTRTLGNITSLHSKACLHLGQFFISCRHMLTCFYQNKKSIPLYPLKQSVLKPLISVYWVLVIFLRSINNFSLFFIKPYSAYISQSI